MINNIVKNHTDSMIAPNGNTFYWKDDIGIGYLKSNQGEQVYDEGYWAKYQSYKLTDMGKNLTNARIKLTNQVTKSPDYVLDIGIGNGQFVEEYGCYGTDVNPYAINWLKSINKYATFDDKKSFDVFTLWDVIEHIEPDDFKEMIQLNEKHIVLSTPIYTSFENVCSSKHFRPDEHILYFTVQGIINYMEFFGYKCQRMSIIETKLGRESIGSFIFNKVIR